MELNKWTPIHGITDTPHHDLYIRVWWFRSDFSSCSESAEIWLADSFSVSLRFFPQARKQGFKHVLEIHTPPPFSHPPTSFQSRKRHMHSVLALKDRNPTSILSNLENRYETVTSGHSIMFIFCFWQVNWCFQFQHSSPGGVEETFKCHTICKPDWSPSLFTRKVTSGLLQERGHYHTGLLSIGQGTEIWQHCACQHFWSIPQITCTGSAKMVHPKRLHLHPKINQAQQDKIKCQHIWLSHY